MDDIRCHACGEVAPAATRFCRRCGANVAMSNVRTPAPPPPEDVLPDTDLPTPVGAVPPPPAAMSARSTPVPGPPPPAVPPPATAPPAVTAARSSNAVASRTSLAPATPAYRGSGRRAPALRMLVLFIALFIVSGAVTALVMLATSDDSGTSNAGQAGVSVPVGAIAVETSPSSLERAAPDVVNVSVASCPGLLAFAPADSCAEISSATGVLFAMTARVDGHDVKIRGYRMATMASGITATSLVKASVAAPEAGQTSVAIDVLRTLPEPAFVLRTSSTVDTASMTSVEIVQPSGDQLTTRGVFVSRDAVVAESTSSVFVAATYDDGSTMLRTVYPDPLGWKMVVESLDPAQVEQRLTTASALVFTAMVSADGAPKSTTTIAPSAPPDPEAAALAQLERYARDDYPLASDLEWLWSVQVSAKRLGVVWRGVTYDYQEILRDHEINRDRYGAILVKSNEWNFGASNGDLWVSIVPTYSVESYDALEFCYANLIGPEDCFAKQLRRDGVATGTVDYQ